MEGAMSNNHTTTNSTDDVYLLAAILPAKLQSALHGLQVEHLIEIIVDLGRQPEARFADEVVRLSDIPVSHEDIAHILAMVGEFTADNRAGIEGTLHRISAIRNRKGQIIGMTMRVGRAVYGTMEILHDLVKTGKSLLLLGRPGVGKTTKLREMARVLADDCNKRVIVIDTSNEIAGDSDIPHAAIGSARRLQVPRPDRQHAVMIEAVENHMPEVIIVDEIGTEAEASAARTIAERGVQLIGTAHGNNLENLIMNPTLSDLVGGVQTVTISDEEARRRGTTKTVTERKAPPTFDILIEMVSRNEVNIHKDTAQAVDALLRGLKPRSEQRKLTPEGKVEIEEQPGASLLQQEKKSYRRGSVRIYPHGVSRELLERAIRQLGLKVRVSASPEMSDMIFTLRSYEGDPALRRLTRNFDVPVHLAKRNSASDMRRMLQKVFNVVQGIAEDEVQEAVQETRTAIQQVQEQGIEIALQPRRSALRKVQHRMIAGSGLEATSIGVEPKKHLVVYPHEKQA
jgi:stage III sporulation protein SpoIIIAA